MEKTTSSVIWNSKSFRWGIRNFSDICGIQAGNPKDNAMNEIEEDEMSISPSEYSCLLDIDFLQSPVIDVGNPTEEGNQTQWIVKLAKSGDDPNHIDLYMELVQIGDAYDTENYPDVSECYFKYHIEILDLNGQSFLKKGTNKINFLKTGNSWCVPGVIDVQKLKTHKDNLLRDDTLELQINLHVLNDLHHSTIDGQAQIESQYSLHLSSGRKRKSSSYRDWHEVFFDWNSRQLKLAKQVLNNLWVTRLNADGIIECAEIKFSIHKSVLSSASPVFFAAFSHDMTENAQNRIVITDISPSIMETVLRFIYCDTNLDESQWRNVEDLAELVNASEKYQISALKCLCFSKLCEELTLNNAAEITALVYLYQPEISVKSFIHQYVIQNINVLKQMKSFKKKVNEVPAAFTPLLFLIGGD